MHPQVQHPGLAKFQAHKAERKQLAVFRAQQETRIQAVVQEIRTHNPDITDTRARTIAAATLKLRAMAR